MTSDATSSSTLRDTVRAGVRDLSVVWWWFLILGVLWTWFGMFVLSYRVGSLTAVAAFVGVAFLLGGGTQLAVAGRVQSWRWLSSWRASWRWPPGSSPSSGQGSRCTWCRSSWPGT